MKVKIRLLHESSIPGSHWCQPIGWDPANKVEGAQYQDGTWWDSNDDGNDAAGLLWFGDMIAYGFNKVMDADLDDLRVASAGDVKILGKVILSEKQ
jgi:hypothetical protein